LGRRSRPGETKSGGIKERGAKGVNRQKKRKNKNANPRKK